MLPGDQCFVAQSGVAVEVGATFRGDILGHIAKNEDDLILHVESRIRIVCFPLLSGNTKAVSGEDDLPIDRAIPAKGQRREVFFYDEGGGFPLLGFKVQRVAFRQDTHALPKLEVLKKRPLVASGLKPSFLQLSSEIVCGQARAFAPGHAACQFF